MIFTIGNLITLGIVACALILFRVLDKGNRSIDRVKKMAEKYKQELDVYADEKGLTVRNYGISLEIEHKAATQLMNEIQQFSQEELAKKAEAISRIDDHIKAFEASLEELFGMTGRVQENLNRIRDESVFVESTNKKINEVKEKFDQAEKSLLLAERNLAATEERLEEKI